MPRIRSATPADAAVIAAFHVAVWRETYGAIAPPEAVATLDEVHRLGAWTRALAVADGRQGTLLALRDGLLAGLVSHGPSEAPAFSGIGEVRHLYVAPSARGQGLGRHLLARAFSALSAAGFTTCGLAVVRENVAARRFYRAMGGTEAAEFRDAGPIWRSDNILVTWPLPASFPRPRDPGA